MRPSARLTSLLLALAVVFLLPSAALAYAPSDDEDITCVPAEDENAECEVEGVQGDVVCTWETSTGESGTVRSNDDGTFTFEVSGREVSEVEVTVECDQDVLSETVTNLGGDDTPDGAPADGIAVLEAGDERDPETLANAGSDSLTLAVLGLGGLALGTGVLMVSRRRA